MAREHEKVEIPASLKSAASEIAAVCKKYDLHHASGRLLLGFDDGWDFGEVEFNWRQGRHGQERHMLNLTFSRTETVGLEF